MTIITNRIAKLLLAAALLSPLAACANAKLPTGNASMDYDYYYTPPTTALTVESPASLEDF